MPRRAAVGPREPPWGPADAVRFCDTGERPSPAGRGSPRRPLERSQLAPLHKSEAGSAVRGATTAACAARWALCVGVRAAHVPRPVTHGSP